MRKKYIYVIMMLVTVFLVSGCAQLKDKFVRKNKKEETKITKYQPVRAYDVHPNLELYTKRYVYWKNWHRELLAVLPDKNHKKIVVAIEQEISNLMDMQGMLTDEKAEGLAALISEMQEVEAQLKREKVTTGNEVRIRRKLENIGKQIKLKFSYTKVRGCIRSDFSQE